MCVCSIFIVRYNKAKEQQKERIQSSRKMRTRNRVKRPIVPLAQSPDTSMNSSCSILSSIPSNRRRRSVDDHGMCQLSALKSFFKNELTLQMALSCQSAMIVTVI